MIFFRSRPIRGCPLPAFAALFSLLPVLTLAACGGKPADSGKPARQEVRFPVETAPVADRAVEYSVHAVGSVEAFERVAVTARVAGVVERVRFREGDSVTAETPLAEIEPERYRLATEAARSVLAKAQATAAEAKNGLDRRQSVNVKNPDLVRAEEVDEWRTRVAAAAADNDQAKTALALAELNQRDAIVRSPVAGIIQTRAIETGKYVAPGTEIATLVRRDPLLLRFRVPQNEATPLAAGIAARFTLRDNPDKRYSAKIRLVGAAADSRDRMVDVTAEVDDPERATLRPGTFVEVEVPVGGAASSAVIPQTAIRPSDRGFLAFVIEGDVAHERVLELGLRTAEGDVEVRQGLKPGELLVIRGAEALREGAKVDLEKKPAADVGVAPRAE
ncbi:MAG: efflux RND transporter periplasmic adaptor subunit [Thermoanaerobaculia bacterium]